MIRPAVLLTLSYLALITQVPAQDQSRDIANAGNEKVAEIIRTFSGRGVQSDGSQPTPAADAVKTVSDAARVHHRSCSA